MDELEVNHMGFFIWCFLSEIQGRNERYFCIFSNISRLGNLFDSTSTIVDLVTLPV